MLDALNFRQFVSVIARFRRVENPSRQLIQRKLECKLKGLALDIPYQQHHVVIFRVFDTDRDGWVSEMDVRNVRPSFNAHIHIHPCTWLHTSIYIHVHGYTHPYTSMCMVTHIHVHGYTHVGTQVELTSCVLKPGIDLVKG